MTARPRGAVDETCRVDAHVAEPEATAQSGDQQARRADAVVPEVDLGSVASLIADLAENEDNNYTELLSACTPSTHKDMTVEDI